MNAKVKVISAVTLFLLSAIIVSVPLSDSNSADSNFTAEDGQGTRIDYDAASGKVMTVGKGLTATVIELGHLDKIVVCDSYSKGSEAVFSELKDKITANSILADGNVYTSGRTALINNAVYAAENMGFDKTKDTILITGSQTYVAPIVSDLKSKGFERILVWNDITTYSDLIQFVKTVSMVVSGTVHDKAVQMEYVAEHIENTLVSNGITSDSGKAKAFFVTYSSSNFKVGNTGSLATSMILAAGGNAVTIDDAKEKPTYTANVTDLISTFGQDTIVFMDNTIVSNSTYLSNIQSLLPGVTLVGLQSLWNNFDPDSMDGVWAMACAMYPEYFSGDVPTVPSGDGPDWLLYGVSALVIVAVIAFMGYLFIRK